VNVHLEGKQDGGEESKMDMSDVHDGLANVQSTYCCVAEHVMLLFLEDRKIGIRRRCLGLVSL